MKDTRRGPSVWRRGDLLESLIAYSRRPSRGLACAAAHPRLRYLMECAAGVTVFARGGTLHVAFPGGAHRLLTGGVDHLALRPLFCFSAWWIVRPLPPRSLNDSTSTPLPLRLPSHLRSMDVLLLLCAPFVRSVGDDARLRLAPLLCLRGQETPLRDLSTIYLAWHEGVTDLRPLCSLPRLAEVVLDRTQASMLADLASSPSLTTLTLLGALATTGLAGLAGLRGLRHLRLVDGDVACTAGLRHCPGVRRLTVEGDGQTMETEVLRHTPALEHLELGDLANTSLPGLRHCPNLRELDLRRCPHLETMAAVENLRTLNILHCRAFRDAAVLRRLPHLASLVLLDTGLAALDEVLRHPALQRLWVEAAELHDVEVPGGAPQLLELSLCGRGLTHLHGIARCTALHRLGLLGGVSLMDLHPLARLPHLACLDLSDSGVSSLEGLRGCPVLRILHLVRCVAVMDVGPLGAIPTLEEVIAAESGVSVVDGLAESPALRVLDLSGCPYLINVTPLMQCRTLRVVDLRRSSLVHHTGLALPSSVIHWVTDASAPVEHLERPVFLLSS